jgi:hypothetical protein
MTPDEMIAFVDELYELTGTGQWDAAAERLTDDFVAIEADGLPMEGSYHGKSGLYDLFVKVMGMMDVVAMDRVETTAGRDHAVTILSLRFADPALEPQNCAKSFAFAMANVARSNPIISTRPPSMPQLPPRRGFSTMSLARSPGRAIKA